VGIQILEHGAFDPAEVDLTRTLLALRRKYSEDGVIALDCGANIGVHTIEWAKQMDGWGSVIAIEPQERVFYALAGKLRSTTASTLAQSKRSSLLRPAGPKFQR